MPRNCSADDKIVGLSSNFGGHPQNPRLIWGPGFWLASLGEVGADTVTALRVVEDPPPVMPFRISRKSLGLVDAPSPSSSAMVLAWISFARDWLKVYIL